MRTLLKAIAALLGILSIVYILGPKAPIPNLNTDITPANSNLSFLEKEIIAHEQATPHIRQNNEARIIWANNSKKEKTPYSLVYLHGYSASQGEGAPMHVDFAKRYGCNLYLARLYGHGVKEEEAMLDMTPEKFMETAKRAIAIGHQLGEKVIVMGTSTGCTAALYLASGNADIAGLINYSPNIAIADPTAWLLTYPWGLQIAKTVTGSDYHSWVPSAETKELVTYKYRLEAVIALQAMLDATMTEATFKKIKQPFFLGYWYKNETIQDDVVSVERMLEMYNQLGTPENDKRKVAFENATNHVLASPLWNKDFEAVKKETFDFAENILKLQPVEVPEITEIADTKTITQ